jgi:hypothetical protein
MRGALARAFDFDLQEQKTKVKSAGEGARIHANNTPPQAPTGLKSRLIYNSQPPATRPCSGFGIGLCCGLCLRGVRAVSHNITNFQEEVL